MGVSDIRRFGAAERASWAVGRAGTVAPSGWVLLQSLPAARPRNARNMPLELFGVSRWRLGGEEGRAECLPEGALS
eukprot:979195-Alexandrium_andersonii.AAC.1